MEIDELVVDKGTKVALGVVVALLSGVAAIGVWIGSMVLSQQGSQFRLEAKTEAIKIAGETQYKSVERELALIRSEIGELRSDALSAASDRFRRTDMKNWIKVFSAKNPELDVPPID